MCFVEFQVRRARERVAICICICIRTRVRILAMKPNLTHTLASQCRIWVIQVLLSTVCRARRSKLPTTDRCALNILFDNLVDEPLSLLLSLVFMSASLTVFARLPEIAWEKVLVPSLRSELTLKEATVSSECRCSSSSTDSQQHW